VSGPATALDIATSLVCGFEGFRAAPYQDTAGVWTIGYGSTRWLNGAPVTHNYPPLVTEDIARQMMAQELEPIVNSVRSFMIGDPDDTGALVLAENEVAACSSFSYNEGIGAFKGSTILHLWLQRDVQGAADHFMDWIYDHDPATHQLVEVPGLKNRRLKEQAVFLGAAP
jgi:lysozyme